MQFGFNSAANRPNLRDSLRGYVQQNMQAAAQPSSRSNDEAGLTDEERALLNAVQFSTLQSIDLGNRLMVNGRKFSVQLQQMYSAKSSIYRHVSGLLEEARRLAYNGRQKEAAELVQSGTGVLNVGMDNLSGDLLGDSYLSGMKSSFMGNLIGSINSVSNEVYYADSRNQELIFKTGRDALGRKMDTQA